MADTVARARSLCGLSPSGREVEIRWPRQKELPVWQGMQLFGLEAYHFGWVIVCRHKTNLTLLVHVTF